MAGSGSSKSSKGIPTKASNKQRGVRRMRSQSRLPEKRLRRILKRNTVREAFEWATNHSSLSILASLRPNYKKELQQAGQSV